ncbi:indole-3-glycerol-phosphate synthase [Ranunculus cassubicifolius]
MEAASMIRSSPRSPFPISSPHKFRTNFTATKSQISLPLMEKNEGTRNVSLRCSPRTHQAEIIDQASGVRSDVEDLEELVRIKDWEVGMYQNELAVRDGIRIRRRPPTEPPRSYYGPFEFELRNQGTSPINILEDIIWTKHAEVLQLKENKPIEEVKKEINNTEVRDFVQALKESHLRTGLPALIAEVKKASPSRGVIRKDFDPVQIAQAYEKGGAACLSVLTDAKYFQGGFENLEAVRNAGIKCPLLCKEFIIDVYQIYYARSKGADAVLLIAAVLPDIDIRYMIKICKTLGLAALVEVHDEREMDRILAIEGIELIGINNRSLETFEVDISNTKKLLEGDRGKTIRDKNIIVVGESGLFTPDDVAYVQNAGVKAVLVGESIVKQDDPGKGIRGLFGKDISS